MCIYIYIYTSTYTSTYVYDNDIIIIIIIIDNNTNNNNNNRIAFTEPPTVSGDLLVSQFRQPKGRWLQSACTSTYTILCYTILYYTIRQSAGCTHGALASLANPGLIFVPAV